MPVEVISKDGIADIKLVSGLVEDFKEKIRSRSSLPRVKAAAMECKAPDRAIFMVCVTKGMIEAGALA